MTIEKPGQFVGLRAFFQLQLQDLLLGHIVDEADNARDFSVIVPNRLFDQLQKFPLAVGVDLNDIPRAFARGENVPVALHGPDRIFLVLSYLRVGLAANRPVGVAVHIQMMPVMGGENVFPLGILEVDNTLFDIALHT